MSDYSIPSLRKYAYLGNFDVAIKELADMARPERWDYVETPDAKKNIILENYIYHTFDRLLALRKAVPRGNYISTSDSEMCFNTGLFTPNFEPIFALFNKKDSVFHRNKTYIFLKRRVWEVLPSNKFKIDFVIF